MSVLKLEGGKRRKFTELVRGDLRVKVCDVVDFDGQFAGTAPS